MMTVFDVNWKDSMPSVADVLLSHCIYLVTALILALNLDEDQTG